jgi:hypothetical protein
MPYSKQRDYRSENEDKNHKMSPVEMHEREEFAAEKKNQEKIQFPRKATYKRISPITKSPPECNPEGDTIPKDGNRRFCG